MLEVKSSSIGSWSRGCLRRTAPGGTLDTLTPREREILALMAEGLTDRGIAERLWLTRKTVETHVRHILRKLELPAGAANNRRVQAVLTYLSMETRRAPGRPTTFR